jgi:hypothetical protein
MSAIAVTGLTDDELAARIAALSATDAKWVLFRLMTGPGRADLVNCLNRLGMRQAAGDTP